MRTWIRTWWKTSQPNKRYWGGKLRDQWEDHSPVKKQISLRRLYHWRKTFQFSDRKLGRKTRQKINWWKISRTRWENMGIKPKDHIIDEKTFQPWPKIRKEKPKMRKKKKKTFQPWPKKRKKKPKKKKKKKKRD